MFQKRRCATHTFALFYYTSTTYIIFANFVFPHKLHSDANVCISFFGIFITFFKLV